MDIQGNPSRNIVRVILFMAALCAIIGIEWLWLTQEGQRTLKIFDDPSFITLDQPEQVSASEDITVSGRAIFPGRIDLDVDGKVYTPTIASFNSEFVFRKVALHEAGNRLTLTSTLVIGEFENPFDPKIESIWRATSQPPTPTIAATKIVNQPHVVVNGTAESGSKVIVTAARNTSMLTRTVPSPATANFSEGIGTFHGMVKLEEAGTYTVTAQATNKAGRASPPSQPIAVTYDPTWIPATDTPLTRVVTATVEFKHFHYDIAVTLPNSDPRLGALATDRRNLYEFLKEEFGSYFHTNLIGLDSELSPDTLQFVNSKDTTTVLASSRARDVQYYELPVFGGELRINTLGSFPILADDRLVLVLKDYTIQSVKPTPSLKTDQSVVWTGERDDISPTDGITISLALAPSALTILQGLARIRLDDLITYSGASTIQFLYDLLIVLPMVWILWLFHKYGASTWLEERIALPFERMTRWLIAAALTGQVIVFADFYWADPTRRYGQVILLAVFAVMAHLLTRVRGEGARAFWWRTVVYGLRDAMLISLALNALLLIFISVPGLAALGYQILAAAASMLFVAVSLWLVLPFFTLWFHRLSMWQPAIILLGIALAFPSYLPSYEVTYLADPVANLYATLSLHLTTFLVLVRYAAPFVFLFGVILLLRYDRTKEELAKPVLFGVGVVLFAVYLVGTTAEWLYIPIPFLLALWLLPHFVLRPVEQRDALDRIAPQVLTERARLITRALPAVQSRLFVEALDRLENKVISGDLTLEEFEKRKQGIEAYLAQQEQASMLANGMKARDVVLSIGPGETNWANGIHAVKTGTVLAFPVVLVVFSSLSQNPYAVLLLLIALTAAFAKWLAAAFFFGYYFPYIRAESGLQKGLGVALAMIAALLPIWLVTQSEPRVIFLQAGGILVFFTLIGIAAFDYRTFRDALGERFSWRKLLLFEGVPGVTAFTSSVVASLGVAVSSAMTGQFATILGAIQKFSLPLLQQLQNVLASTAKHP